MFNAEPPMPRQQKLSCNSNIQSIDKACVHEIEPLCFCTINTMFQCKNHHKGISVSVVFPMVPSRWLEAKVAAASFSTVSSPRPSLRWLNRKNLSNLAYNNSGQTGGTKLKSIAVRKTMYFFGTCLCHVMSCHV